MPKETIQIEKISWVNMEKSNRLIYDNLPKDLFLKECESKIFNCLEWPKTLLKISDLNGCLKILDISIFFEHGNREILVFKTICQSCSSSFDFFSGSKHVTDEEEKWFGWSKFWLNDLIQVQERN